MISISGSSGTNVHVSLPRVDPWIREAAAEIAKRAPRELEALVAVSSPSGDVHGADECALGVRGAGCPTRRRSSASPARAPATPRTWSLRLHGTGTRQGAAGRPHRHRRRARRAPAAAARRASSCSARGSVDMKGGDMLAIGALRAFAKRPELYEQLALLLVCDEEWRTADFGHVARFAGFDACLCFEAGELAGRRRGRRRAPQGRGHDPRHRARPQRPQRLRAGPRAQRAARAGARRAGGGRARTTRAAQRT